MQRLQAGQDAAAAELFRRYAGRLIGLARSRLGKQIQQKVDAEDVLQSVLRSFFVRCPDLGPEVASWDSLWGLLTTITLRKCGRKLRYYRQARRDVGREAAADVASLAEWQALDREPAPPEVAQLTETVEQLLRAQDERGRQIIVLTLQGLDRTEVAAAVKSSRRTVERVLQRVRQQLLEPYLHC